MRLQYRWNYAQIVHTISMRVIWNRGKAAANLLKHRVDFSEAHLALHDDQGLTTDDPGHDEQRFRSIVMSPAGAILVVVFALPGKDTIRLISARKASKAEREHYLKDQ